MEFSKQQGHVCQMLREAVITLCRNLVPFQSDITVEGLLGITVDKQNVILVNILKQIPGPSFGADPETGDDIKDFEALLHSNNSITSAKMASHDWSAEFRPVSSSAVDKIGDESNGLAVKEEPAISQTSTGYDDETMGKKHDLFNTEDSPRIKGQNVPMKYLGVRDELLPMDHDFSALEEISSHLDYNSQLSPSPTKNSSNDLFGKAEDFLSVKEESDSFTSGFINDSETCLGDSILPEVLDSDFGEGPCLNGSDKFACSHCGMIFSHRRSLRRHKKKHEGIDKVWQCKQCTQMFNRKDILQRHVKKHHEVKQLRCPLCSKLFSRPDSMKRHHAMAHSAQ
ncbi:hypothetical protein LSH36_180g04009 [Paralvinella palmiformis]|uniref:C2H2-type domain-containing protein n=1 Tax=Paralvinella palmiformis TaxID=53620 RepID=A0AAD9JRN2_9ANNE|nr:hypothetical protein LSH36_180g04009 [Paralvinella palmiformis]